MNADDSLQRDRFPRASAYHPAWILAGVAGGANPLWLTEWLCEGLELRPGMRVLDLGCGRALSSIFLHREYGVQVWATDLWISPAENLQRVQDAGAQEGVFPVSADARALPFAEGFFDAVVSIDSFMYYGTDDLYLNSLARYVKPNGPIGIAQAGWTNEIAESVPPHLADWCGDELAHCLHSAAWWRRHWERSGCVEVAVADMLPEGWRDWRDWLRLVSPENERELRALDADAGQHCGYIRVIGHRRPAAKSFDPSFKLPAAYIKRPLLRAAMDAST